MAESQKFRVLIFENIIFKLTSHAWLCDAKPTVTFPVVGHRRPLTGTNLYCLVTGMYRPGMWRISFTVAFSGMMYRLSGGTLNHGRSIIHILVELSAWL